ncbi:MAG: sodium:solute symporter [Planctomycetaceae bacterium]
MLTAHSIDLAVVAVYLIVVTAIGCLMSRKTHTSTEFISAGGTLPGWVVGLSIVGTFVSSISFIANPGKTFASNWSPFVFSLSLPYAAWVATTFFVPFFRNCGSLSAYEHLEHRFGAWARLYAALFNVLYHVGRIGTILFGVSLAVSALIDVPVPAIIVGLGILVILYTLLGGIEAVIWTDVVQSIILIGGMLACVVMLIMTVPGGLPGIIDAAHSTRVNKLSLGSMDVDFSVASFWTVLVFGFFINLQNFAADQTFVQRYFAARTQQDAARSVWMGAIAYLPISAILFFIGTGLFVFYQTAEPLPEGVAPDSVLPHFIMHELPTGVSGLLIAAILAAAMSTVDSSLNSSATLLLCDVRNRFFLKVEKNLDGSLRMNDVADLKFLRLMTVVLGIAGISVGLAMIGVQRMLDAWWQISGVLSGGTLGLILLARFSSVSGIRGAAIGVVAGVIATAAIVIAGQDEPATWLLPVWNHVRPLRTWLHPLMAIVVGTLIVVICGLLLSRRRSTP